MSKSQQKATSKYRAKQIQVQALINPETEKELAEDWEYLKRQFGGSGKKALAWSVMMAKHNMLLFRVWKDGDNNEELLVRAVNMNAALDEAAFRYGFVDYADMAQELGWSGSEGLNITGETEG